MTITPADLAVGQVCYWLGVAGHRFVLDRVDLHGDSVDMTCDVCGRSSTKLSWLAQDINEGTITLGEIVPPPIPHPAALKDLYEACKELAVLAEEHAARHLGDRNAGAIVARVRSAIRKAGGEA